MDPKDKNDHESSGEEIIQPKLKFPRSIPFVIINDFCEQFTYYGLRAILVLYLTRKLMYDDDTATIIFHTFNVFMYCMCIFGGIIADSWWGKFKTIVILSIVYSTGSVIVAIGAIETLNLPGRELTILGLLVIAIGCGGIKPCVAALGGEQFKLPEQLKQLALFFSIYFFSVNFGALISAFSTPLLRANVGCFGMDDCFPLAFGVAAIVMITGTIVFILGKPLYVLHPIRGNMIVKVCACLWTAICLKLGELRNKTHKSHWLDYAEAKHGRRLVLETKVFFTILKIYCILPIIWALLEQQGSRWIFQATRMNGDIGFMVVQPDQMPVINPLLVMIFVPSFEVIVYPFLAKIRLGRPLQKLTLGGILLGVAFVISALVELSLQPTYAILPEQGQTQLRIYNGMNCNYTFENSQTSLSIEALGKFEDRHIWTDAKEFKEQFEIKSESEACPNFNGKFKFELESRTAVSYFMRESNGKLQLERFIDDPSKSPTGLPVIRILADFKTSKNLMIRSENSIVFNSTEITKDRIILSAGKYEFFVDDQKIHEENLKTGGVYAIILKETAEGGFQVKTHTMTEPNSVSILWQIPQYVVLVTGQVIFSVNGLQFSFTQAPESMKSVLLGFFNLTIAVGNLIVILVASIKFFEPVGELFFFSGLMFLNMILFAYLAYNYKPTLLEELNVIEQQDDSQTTTSFDEVDPTKRI